MLDAITQAADQQLASQQGVVTTGLVQVTRALRDRAGTSSSMELFCHLASLGPAELAQVCVPKMIGIYIHMCMCGWAYIHTCVHVWVGIYFLHSTKMHLHCTARFNRYLLILPFWNLL